MQELTDQDAVIPDVPLAVAVAVPVNDDSTDTSLVEVPAQTIQPGEQGVFRASGNAHSASGTSGVVRYRVKGLSIKNPSMEQMIRGMGEHILGFEFDVRRGERSVSSMPMVSIASRSTRFWKVVHTLLTR